MHTTFPTFSYNENQKAIVWLLWSLCVLQRGGIRSISSVCVSLANEMMSAKWWGQEAAGSMSWDSACKPGTVEGLCSCFSSDWHQGWRKEITGKNHPLLYEQNQILKALSWKSRKCLSHLTCMCVSGSSAAHFGIKVECSRGNGNDGDSAGRDLGQPHHSWAASELPEKFWRALALQGHRQRGVTAPWAPHQPPNSRGAWGHVDASSTSISSHGNVDLLPAAQLTHETARKWPLWSTENWTGIQHTLS